MRKTITPEMAKNILDNNHSKQRKVNRRRVMKYAEEIREGMWLYNGESIIVSKTGKLLDGQHRLMAIVEANLPIESAMITDVEDEQDGIDTFITINAENRSNTDALYIDGFREQTSNIVKLIRLSETFNEKLLKQKPNGKMMTNPEIVLSSRAYGESNALEVIERALRLHERCPLLSTTYWIALSHVFKGNPKGQKFMEELAECNQDIPGNPVSALLKLFTRFEGTGSGGKVSKIKWIGIFKAYKAYTEDTPITMLRVDPSMPVEYPLDYKNYMAS